MSWTFGIGMFCVLGVVLFGLLRLRKIQKMMEQKKI
jgi:hypothetical protein